MGYPSHDAASIDITSLCGSAALSDEAANMDQSPAFPTLTPRERECLLLAADHGSKEIATILGLSVGTVETHIKAGRRKLGGVDRRQASRLLRSLESAPQLPGSQALGMSDDADFQAIPIPPAPLVGTEEPPSAVREVRSTFDAEPQLINGGKTDHDLTIRSTLFLLILAPLALGCLVLIMVAILGSIDRVLPAFYPNFHPN